MARDIAQVARPKTRRKRAYGEITIDGIVDAALAIVRRAGVSGLSMRALADELSLSSMATYHYVKDKDELVDLLIDRTLAQVWLPEVPGGFEARWREHFSRTRRMFRDYPGLALLAATRFPHGKENRRLNRQISDALKAEGVQDCWTPAIIFLLGTHFFGAVSWDAESGARLGDVYERNLEDSLTIIFEGIAAKRRSSNNKAPPRKIVMGKDTLEAEA